MWKNNLRFAFCRALAKKIEPFERKEWHVAAHDQIPFAIRRTLRGILKCSNDSAERPFSWPAVFDNSRSETSVLARRRNYHERLVSPKSCAPASRQNISTDFRLAFPRSHPWTLFFISLLCALCGLCVNS